MTIQDKYKISGLIGEVLSILEPRIKELMDEYQINYESKWKKSPSKFDLECTEMYLVLDIIKSFGKYTKSGDKVVEISSSIKGNLEIKKMNKVQRLEEDLARVENRKKENLEKIEKYSRMNDEELFEESKQSSCYYEFPTWEVICERGADKNYEYSEEYYNNYVENSRLEDIERFKRYNIESPKNQIPQLDNEIKRIKSKIEEAK